MSLVEERGWKKRAKHISLSLSPHCASLFALSPRNARYSSYQTTIVRQGLFKCPTFKCCFLVDPSCKYSLLVFLLFRTLFSELHFRSVDLAAVSNLFWFSFPSYKTLIQGQLLKPQWHQKVFTVYQTFEGWYSCWCNYLHLHIRYMRGFFVVNYQFLCEQDRSQVRRFKK